LITEDTGLQKRVLNKYLTPPFLSRTRKNTNSFGKIIRDLLSKNIKNISFREETLSSLRILEKERELILRLVFG